MRWLAGAMILVPSVASAMTMPDCKTFLQTMQGVQAANPSPQLVRTASTMEGYLYGYMGLATRVTGSKDSLDKMFDEVAPRVQNFCERDENARFDTAVEVAVRNYFSRHPGRRDLPD